MLSTSTIICLLDVTATNQVISCGLIVTMYYFLISNISSKFYVNSNIFYVCILFLGSVTSLYLAFYPFIEILRDYSFFK